MDWTEKWTEWWISQKHEAIFRKDKFKTELDWAEAYFEGNDEEIDNYLINSEKHREDLERDFRNFPPQSSIISLEISEQIAQIINLIAIK